MGFRADPISLEYDDEDLYDQRHPEYEPPAYPYGCRFDIDEGDLQKAAGEKGKPGEVMNFSAMAEVTSVRAGKNDCRVELQIKQFAGEDGKLFDIEQPKKNEGELSWYGSNFGCICLCGPELDKMGLEADCDLGDTIHLTGEVCLEGLSRTEARGDVATLQITKLAFEDEGDEQED